MVRQRRMRWVMGLWAFGWSIVLLFGSSISEAQAVPSTPVHEMTVYRGTHCNCCGQWLDTLQSAGFEIEDHVVDDVYALKDDLGVPEALATCHTGRVDGYLVEGHVPVADIQRLLAEKSDVAGIAVPGMPMGSPGMESDDGEARKDPFSVVTFTNDGTTQVFHDYPQGF